MVKNYPKMGRKSKKNKVQKCQYAEIKKVQKCQYAEIKKVQKCQSKGTKVSVKRYKSVSQKVQKCHTN